jgi:hypothetical protein
MTNILFWNIRQFGIKKINDTRGGGPANAGGLTYPQVSADRRAIILAEIAATTADIIAIVEVGTGNTAGDLATNTGGVQGSQALLNLLRAANGAAGWRMVPPLWMGSRAYRSVGGLETVAVLYRGVTGNVTRYFTGPNFWSGGAGGISTDPAAGVGAPANYPPQFNGFLRPPGTAVRQIPIGSLYRPSTAFVPSLETQSAARIKYVRPSTKRPRGGVPYAPSRYGGFRPPYMTSFYEVNALTGATRTLTLFSIHAPPRRGDAATLMRTYSQTPEIANAPAGGEIKILAGDFNLNFLNANGNYTNAYAPVTALGYQSLLPTAAVPPVTAGGIEQFRGNFATHLRSVPTRPLPQPAADTLFLWTDPAIPVTDSYYPAYGCTSAGDNTDSLDNILVRPAAGYALTIMNLVTGSPFQVAVPANNAPLGAVALASQFTNPLPLPANPWPQAPAADDFFAADAVQLSSWPNYGRIYSTSDHFGLTTVIP